MLYRMLTRSNGQNKRHTLITSSFAVICISALTMPLHAQTIADAIEQCTKESNSLKRLVCFDRMAKDMRQFDGVEQPFVQTVPVVKQRKNETPLVTTKPEATETIDDFGLQQPEEPEKADVALVDGILYATLSGVEEYYRDRLSLTLDNGQVWRQVDSSNMLTPKVGDSIRIEKGLFGSFVMYKEGSKRRMRVKRFQ